MSLSQHEYLAVALPGERVIGFPPSLLRSQGGYLSSGVRKGATGA